MNPILSALSPTATNMIRLDHTHVLATFHRYKADTAPGTKQALAETICLALEIHAQLEEEIFYPAVRALMPDNEAVRKSVPEHDEMKRLIAKLRQLKSPDLEFDETLLELMRDVIHHVADEETILLPAAERSLGDQLSELGAQMTKRRLELAAPRAGQIAGNMVRGMPGTTAVMLAAMLGTGWLMGRGAKRR